MASPISLREPAWLQEFKAFIMRGSVVDLAVGLVIGAAFTTIVTSLVEDLINPFIGLIIGGVDFSNVFVVLNGERRASLAATREGGAAVLAVGSFINTVIKFLIVAFAIFWVVKALSRLRLHELGKAPPVATPTEKLLAEIRDELKAQRAK
ncbi:large-conductance mechanosensitive channel [Siccirubricoccus deserti]|uniref:Large-conductance mechanosensitive channel n=1 Tax=Siccirubricoccus deserti TaxID=2013562 RepID=A0A9X0UCC9_9PROT|nr:large conductance mechanosensitive channel protein MscL [Siccirubricoccus deserti]MBC4015129.1 large conductance mechanosensitive channel protein MscL [Siccirubricoccus deserti]GGC38739.1 large-conductance mechanosensitive channel [Siccirubricoccus deserti]